MCHQLERWWPPSSGMQRVLVHCLPSERPNYQWGILCQLADAAAKGNQVKTAWKTDEGGPVSPGQCSCHAHKCVVTMAVVWLWLWTGWSPSIFSWFGPVWLFSVPQHVNKQKNLAGKQYRTDDEFISAIEEFFEDQDESFCTTVYHGNPSAVTPMEEVCGPQGRLCWKTNHNTLLKSDVTRRDHVVRCHGSHECWFTHRQFHSQFHSRRHSLRITLKSTTLVHMRSGYAWTMKSWQRSEWRLGFHSVLVNLDHCITVSLWTFQPTLVALVNENPSPFIFLKCQVNEITK